MSGEKQNRFKKRSWLMMLALLFICGMVLIYGAEKIAANQLQHRNVPGPWGRDRHIRLRECNPGSSGVQIPTEHDIAESDVLEKKEYPISIDKDGFINPSGVNENPDIKIVFLGGSTTACLFVSEDKRFPSLVGRMIQDKTGKKVNTYNSGVPGNNTLHSLDILLNKIVPMNPDVVVMMHNLNDLNALIYEGSYWNENTSRSPHTKTSKEHRFKGVP